MEFYIKMSEDKAKNFDIHEFTKRLPKKRMASGALILNDQKEVLLVNPNYRDNWLIPGGMVEDNESPHNACLREIKEEIDLTLSITRLLIVDYMPESNEGTEALHFVFDGGVLSNEQIEQIKICDKELLGFRFVPIHQLYNYLPKALHERLMVAIERLNSYNSAYLEAGIPLLSQ